MSGALEVINNDPNVRSILINIFGGITKGEEVANGIVAALGRVQIDSPIVIRLDGTNADEGREILKAHLSDTLQMQPTMLEAAKKAVELAGKAWKPTQDEAHLRRREHQGRLPGLTGSQGRFYGLLNRAYGTQVVAARTRRRPAPTSKASPSSRRSPKP